MAVVVGRLLVAHMHELHPNPGSAGLFCVRLLVLTGTNTKNLERIHIILTIRTRR